MSLDTTFVLADLTPQYIKDNYLTGLKLLDEDGCELPEEWYWNQLNIALATVEELTQVDIIQRVMSLATGNPERHDYDINDYVQYSFIQLYRTPAASVEEVRAVYPTGQVIQTFPKEWIRLNKEHSQFQLVPTSGSLSQVVIGQGADYLPLVFGHLGKLPQLWEVDYTSGFDPTKIPITVIDAIAKLASINMLVIVQDLMYPPGVGSQSVSIDGMSQSRSYQPTPFTGRINQYKSDLYGTGGAPGLAVGQIGTGLMKQIRDSYHGILMASL